MIIVFQLAVASHAFLFALESAIPWCRNFLPLAGSAIAQFGVLMAFAVAAFEFCECLN